MSIFKKVAFRTLFGRQPAPAVDASLKNLVERVDAETERDELVDLLAAPSPQSATTLITGGQAQKRRRGAAKNSTWDDVVAPPIALPNSRLAGNQLKSANAADPTLVMRALYDDAQAITQVLAAFETFTPYQHLIFDEDGLSMQVMHASGAVSVELKIPRTSFYSYDNLLPGCEPVAVVVSSGAVHSLSECKGQSAQTISFLYHQCGRTDEPLHIYLNPRDNNSATAIRVFYHLPNCEDEDNVQAIPEHQMQYEVRLSAQQLLSEARQLAKTTSCIVLMLRHDADGTMTFEMGGVSDAKFDARSCSFGHAEAEVRTQSQCTISCLQPGAPESNLAYFVNHRVLPQLLIAVAKFGSLTPASEVVLQFGVRLDALTGYAEEPVHVTFPMRSDTQAPFTVDAWIATQVVKA